MFLLEIYFTLTLIIFIVTIPFYISRVREFRSVKSQYSILILLIIMYTIFAVNFSVLTPGSIGESFDTILFSSLSQILLLFSVLLFIKSFYLFDDIVVLKPPSRYRARKCIIEIGKVMKKERKKHKFFLSLKDLERHMFVCGTTGSGKSNTILENNVNSNNEYGIQVSKSKGIDIEKNLIYNNLKDGLFIVISDNCEIINNIIENNENNGITTYASHDDLYIRNVIRNNLKLGISFDLAQYSNLLYENCFIENTINAQDNGTDNQWDNGITGNYWDVYSGSDTDGNGIGDVPYNLAGSVGSQDNFPLKKCPGSTPQEGGGIPGYNLFLLLAILSIVAIILRKKKK